MPTPRRFGRYRLIQRIGRGGMGEVHLARLEAAAGIRRLVAIKLVLQGADDVKSSAALLAEARLSALLSHPNVVQMFDAGIDDGTPWFAMEFVPGLPLSEVMHLGAGNTPPWVCARIVADACAGVNAVHEAKDERGKPLNIVHRDVTPHNVLVSWDGIVKLADFGVARSALQSTSTQVGVVKGKLGYMSPEQAAGSAVDRRCDIFALGILLWEALAGRRLFLGATDSETVARVLQCSVPPLADIAVVPASLADIAARALARDPAARYATALEMQRAIEAAIDGAGVFIAASDVAQVLARIAPDRVREHEKWLRDESELGVPPSERSAQQATLTSIEAAAPTLKRRPVRLAATVVLTLSAATALTLLRIRPWEKSTPRRDDTLATSAVATGTVSAAAATSTPLAPLPSPAEIPRAAQTDVAAEPKREAPKPPPRPRPAETPVGVGTLNVSATPTWASIRLDGKPAGSTPTVISDVRAGSHVVEALPRGNGPAKRRVVTVSPSETTRLEFVFE